MLKLIDNANSHLYMLNIVVYLDQCMVFDQAK